MTVADHPLHRTFARYLYAAITGPSGAGCGVHHHNPFSLVDPGGKRRTSLNSQPAQSGANRRYRYSLALSRWIIFLGGGTITVAGAMAAGRRRHCQAAPCKFSQVDLQGQQAKDGL